MTEEEREKGFWADVEEAEERWGMMLGVFVDEDGEAEPYALALEQVYTDESLH